MSPVDVLIVTAVMDEYREALEVNQGAVDASWAEEAGPLGFKVALRSFAANGGGALRIAVTRTLDMGGIATANLVAPLVNLYRPRCLAMCGVCAGRKGHVQLGDVIVADRLWTYDTGKTIAETDEETGNQVTTFKADPFQYNLAPLWKHHAESFKPAPSSPWLAERPRSYDDQRDWLLERIVRREDPRTHPDRPVKCKDYSAILSELWKQGWVKQGSLALQAPGKKHIESLLLLHPDGLPEPAPFKVHVGPIGTGTSVVEDDRIFDKLSLRMRKVLGLEMEAAAIGAIAELHDVEHMIVMKGVMDFADPKRNDNFKPFAARASAECLIAFLREHLGGARPAERAEPANAAPEQGPLLPRLQAVGFVAELKQIFYTQDAVHHLLGLAGIPLQRLMAFNGTTPEIFWERTCNELSAGSAEGGLQALVLASAKLYPGNGVLKAAVKVVGA